MEVSVVATGDGFGLALIVSAFLLGLRHGIDWDHIAAITDIAASQESPRAGFRLGSLYVVGHAAVVFVLGAVAIAFGAALPEGIDSVMARVVGWTLIALGAYVIYTLARDGMDFRMRSRWMLILSGVRRAYRTIRRAVIWREGPAVSHDHEHALTAAYHHGESEEMAATGRGKRTHRHHHSHDDDAFTRYGTGTSIGVGMLHGIGAETPTQVVVFLAAAHAGGTAAGVAVLVAFLAGLMISNTALTVASSFGFLATGRDRKVYLALGALTGVASLVVGVLFVAGQDSMLPAFLN